MANEALSVIIDIEFPDDMTDSENPFPGGTRRATDTRETFKILRDGCTSQGFDISKVLSNSLFAIHNFEMICHLEEQ